MALISILPQEFAQFHSQSIGHWEHHSKIWLNSAQGWKWSGIGMAKGQMVTVFYISWDKETNFCKKKKKKKI